MGMERGLDLIRRNNEILDCQKRVLQVAPMRLQARAMESLVEEQSQIEDEIAEFKEEWRNEDGAFHVKYKF